MEKSKVKKKKRMWQKKCLRNVNIRKLRFIKYDALVRNNIAAEKRKWDIVKVIYNVNWDEENVTMAYIRKRDSLNVELMKAQLIWYSYMVLKTLLF